MKSIIFYLLAVLLMTACSPMAQNTQQLDLVDHEAFVEMEDDRIMNESEDVLKNESPLVYQHKPQKTKNLSPQWQQYPPIHKPVIENSEKLIIPAAALAGMMAGFPSDFLNAAFSGQKLKYKYTIRGGLIGTVFGVAVYYITKDADEDIVIEDDQPFDQK